LNPLVEELTPVGRGGVSVLRVWGPGAAARVRQFVGAGEIDLESPGGPHRVRFVDGGETLDEAMLLMRADGSIELHLHGSPAVVRRVVKTLGGDSPPAGGSGLPMEEQALRLSADAPGPTAARMLLDQAEGALRRELLHLALASDDERPALVDSLLERGRIAGHLLTPPFMVLAGPVNAGKSSLFNLLLAEQRVVVHATAGTTRDPVRERVHLGEWVIEVADTAGERELAAAGDPVVTLEAEGQFRARLLAEKAALVLWMDPRGAGPPRSAEGGVPAIPVRSKADLPGRGGFGVELSTRKDPAGAVLVVESILLETLNLPRAPHHSGEGVPFTPALMDAVQLAGGEADPNRRRTLVDEICARGRV